MTALSLYISLTSYTVNIHPWVITLEFLAQAVSEEKYRAEQSSEEWGVEWSGMSVGAGYIKNLVVFNRRLGCTDESATDEEQAEKILYYYPEDASLYSQVREWESNGVEGKLWFCSVAHCCNSVIWYVMLVAYNRCERIQCIYYVYICICSSLL